MPYYLQHKREPARRISAVSFTQCRSDYFRSWREDDGSIPWRIIHESPQGVFELAPFDGSVLRRHCP